MIFGSQGGPTSDKIMMSLRAACQILKIGEKLLRKSKILLENVNNKSPSVVQSRRKSCRVNMTVLLSFEEKTDDASTYAQSGHCPLKVTQFFIMVVAVTF